MTHALTLCGQVVAELSDAECRQILQITASRPAAVRRLAVAIPRQPDVSLYQTHPNFFTMSCRQPVRLELELDAIVQSTSGPLHRSVL